MKKTIAIALVLFCIISLVVCDNKSGKDFDKVEDKYQFEATILEIYENSLLVKPADGTTELNSSDKIVVSTQNTDKSIGWKVGDLVLITYSGVILESYPAQLHQVYKVEKISSNPAEDKNQTDGSRHHYSMNSDGMWECNGYTYKYKLEISGRIPNAKSDSTFIYLSNLETITFQQAWKAAGLSSNMNDYFAVEDAVLVEWLT